MDAQPFSKSLRQELAQASQQCRLDKSWSGNRRTAERDQLELRVLGKAEKS